MDTIISAELAAEIARGIRRQATQFYQQGGLNKFTRGLMQGEMNIVSSYMSAPRWIISGIENELDYLCRRACQEGQ